MTWQVDAATAEEDLCRIKDWCGHRWTCRGWLRLYLEVLAPISCRVGGPGCKTIEMGPPE